MTFKKKFLLVIVLLLISASIKAQRETSINVGWNISHFFKPLSNLEIPMYQFNQANPDLKQQYNMPEFFNGINLSLMTGNEKAGAIIAWGNKHGIATAEGIASGETEYKIKKFKTKLNIFSIGPYFKVLKIFKLGITYDIGTFKILKKRALAIEFDDAKWEAFYDKKGNWTSGFSINLTYQLNLGKAFNIKLQPYAQFLWLLSYPTYSTTYSSQKYYYNPSNYGLTTYLSLNWGK